MPSSTLRWTDSVNTKQSIDEITVIILIWSQGESLTVKMRQKGAERVKGHKGRTHKVWLGTGWVLWVRQLV